MGGTILRLIRMQRILLTLAGVFLLGAGCAVQQPQYWGGSEFATHERTDSTYTASPPSDTALAADARAVVPSFTPGRITTTARIDESNRAKLELIKALRLVPTQEMLAPRRPPRRDTVRIALASATGRLTSTTQSTVWAMWERGLIQPDDSDGDGVPDSLDLCAQTPINAIVNQRGCPQDDDGDGVYDGIDQCPGTPNFVRMVVDSVGCPADEDGDGVPDYLDYCLGTPRGLEVTKLGCPPDGDGDGVPDIYDHCPDTPKGMDVDSTGCLVQTQLHRQLALQISYVPGTTELDKLSRRILDDLAIRLADSPSTVAVIEGFTKDVPSSLSALVASHNHVRTIIDYLADRGIGDDRIKAVNVPDTDHPAEKAPAVAGLQDNYHIEISFYSDDE